MNRVRRVIGPQARRRRRLLVPAAVVLLLAVAWGWFAVTKIWFPRLDPVPADVDVVMQVGGIPPGDYQAARDLAQRLHVGDLVLSNPVGRSVEDSYCGPLDGVRVHCFAPDPSTTRGEAREFAALAEQNGWHSAYVMGTGREHVARVRLYFGRCWDGELAVNRPESGRSVVRHLREGLYQTAGWARALTYDRC